MCNAVQPRLVGADWCSPVCALYGSCTTFADVKKDASKGLLFTSLFVENNLTCKINQHILRPCKYLHAGLASRGFGRFLNFMRMDRMDRMDQYVDLLLNFVEGPRHIMYHHLRDVNHLRT